MVSYLEWVPREVAEFWAADAPKEERNSPFLTKEREREQKRHVNFKIKAKLARQAGFLLLWYNLRQIKPGKQNKQSKHLESLNS